MAVVTVEADLAMEAAEEEGKKKKKLSMIFVLYLYWNHGMNAISRIFIVIATEEELATVGVVATEEVAATVAAAVVTTETLDRTFATLIFRRSNWFPSKRTFT